MLFLQEKNEKLIRFCHFYVEKMMKLVQKWLWRKLVGSNFSSQGVIMTLRQFRIDLRWAVIWLLREKNPKLIHISGKKSQITQNWPKMAKNWSKNGYGANL